MKKLLIAAALVSTAASAQSVKTEQVCQRQAFAAYQAAGGSVKAYDRAYEQCLNTHARRR